MLGVLDLDEVSSFFHLVELDPGAAGVAVTAPSCPSVSPVASSATHPTSIGLVVFFLSLTGAIL